jgi:hypothetical protein
VPEQCALRYYTFSTFRLYSFNRSLIEMPNYIQAVTDFENEVRITSEF